MTVAALMAELRSRGVELRVESDVLLFRPRNVVTGELLDAMRAHKRAVMAALETEPVPDVPPVSECAKDWTPHPVPVAASSEATEGSRAASRLGVHFSSETAEWATPDDLFQELNDIFHFVLDACATPANAKCPRFFTKEQDALTKRWEGTTWMNPPYGREIARFMKKAYEESLAGSTVVCLVPSRTDTDWWHRYAKRGQVTHLPGRLKFGGAKASAPFPSAIVIFWGGRLGRAVRPELSDV